MVGDAPLRQPPAPRLVALCGLGGAGKTSVAVEYAHRHLAEVGMCWQLPAEDLGRVASYRAMAEVRDAASSGTDQNMLG